MPVDPGWLNGLSRRMNKEFGDYSKVIRTCDANNITIDKVIPGVSNDTWQQQTGCGSKQSSSNKHHHHHHHREKSQHSSSSTLSKSQSQQQHKSSKHENSSETVAAVKASHQKSVTSAGHRHKDKHSHQKSDKAESDHRKSAKRDTLLGSGDQGVDLWTTDNNKQLFSQLSNDDENSMTASFYRKSPVSQDILAKDLTLSDDSDVDEAAMLGSVPVSGTGGLFGPSERSSQTPFSQHTFSNPASNLQQLHSPLFSSNSDSEPPTNLAESQNLDKWEASGLDYWMNGKNGGEQQQQRRRREQDVMKALLELKGSVQRQLESPPLRPLEDESADDSTIPCVSPERRVSPADIATEARYVSRARCSPTLVDDFVEEVRPPKRCEQLFDQLKRKSQEDVVDNSGGIVPEKRSRKQSDSTSEPIQHVKDLVLRISLKALAQHNPSRFKEDSTIATGNTKLDVGVEQLGIGVLGQKKLPVSKKIPRKLREERETQTEEAPPISRPTAAVPPVVQQSDVSRNASQALSQPVSASIVSSNVSQNPLDGELFVKMDAAQRAVSDRMEKEWSQLSFEQLSEQAAEERACIDKILEEKSDSMSVYVARKHFFTAAKLYLMACWRLTRTPNSHQQTRHAYRDLASFVRAYDKIFQSYKWPEIVDSNGNESQQLAKIRAAKSMTTLTILMLRSVIEAQLFKQVQNDANKLCNQFKSNQISSDHKDRYIQCLQHLYHANELWGYYERQKHFFSVQLKPLLHLETEVMARAGVRPQGPNERISNIVRYLDAVLEFVAGPFS